MLNCECKKNTKLLPVKRSNLMVVLCLYFAIGEIFGIEPNGRELITLILHCVESVFVNMP